jgi:UDP-N-acetyl-D-glucosamine dehydrogenase
MIQLADSLEAKIDSRRARIAIVGLGTVGLPLARAFVRAGFSVLGFDRDRAKIARLARGENTLAHLEPEFVSALLATKRFEVSADADRLSDVDAALIAVPTPLSPRREPDLECVRTAAALLAEKLRRGALVVLESTSHPGTTREIVGDIFRAHGWTPGEDCWLAYSPEREDPGRAIDATTIPKLAGGTCARSSDLAVQLYRAAFAHVVRTSSAEVAEAAKLLENTFRAVNIALANEMKVVLDALAIDVWEVIEAAATKPFGFMKFTPGPGLGGHCIPIDPHYLEHAARAAGASSRLITLASEINRSMPLRVVEKTRAALARHGTLAIDAATGAIPPAIDAQAGANTLAIDARPGASSLAGARVLILGAAYKPDVDIVTESPSLELIDLFAAEGADVQYSDPHVPELAARHRSPALVSLELDAAAIERFDAVVVATDHARFDWELVATSARLVIDTRRALESRMRGRASYVTA